MSFSDWVHDQSAEVRGHLRASGVFRTLLQDAAELFTSAGLIAFLSRATNPAAVLLAQQLMGQAFAQLEYLVARGGDAAGAPHLVDTVRQDAELSETMAWRGKASVSNWEITSGANPRVHEIAIVKFFGRPKKQLFAEHGLSRALKRDTRSKKLSVSDIVQVSGLSDAPECLSHPHSSYFSLVTSNWTMTHSQCFWYLL